MSASRGLPKVQNTVVATVERTFKKLLKPFVLIFMAMQVSSIIVFARLAEHSDLTSGFYAQLQNAKQPSPPSGLVWAPRISPVRLRPIPGTGEVFYFDIALFLFLGLGLSMVFLRKYGYSSIGFSMLTACISLQWGFLLTELFDTEVSCSVLKGFVLPSKDCFEMMLSTDYKPEFEANRIRQGCYCKLYDGFTANASSISASAKNSWLAKDTLRVLGRSSFSSRIALTYESFGDGMWDDSQIVLWVFLVYVIFHDALCRYAAASVVIGTGAYIGKMSPDQSLVIGFIQVMPFVYSNASMFLWASQVFAYVINRWLCLRYLIGAFDDNGGSCTIHVFGAFFGLFVSKFGSNRDADNNPDNSSRYNRCVFCSSFCSSSEMTSPHVFAVTSSQLLEALWCGSPSLHSMDSWPRPRPEVLSWCKPPPIHGSLNQDFCYSCSFEGQHSARPYFWRCLCVCFFWLG